MLFEYIYRSYGARVCLHSVNFMQSPSSNLDVSDATAAPTLEPMETPALSKIKGKMFGSPLACCASPGNYERKRPELGDATPTKTQGNGSSSSSRHESASKETEEERSGSGPTFCTFEEPGTLGLRFEVRCLPQFTARFLRLLSDLGLIFAL